MRTNALALIAGKAVLGGSLALGLLLTPHATAHAAPAGIDAYAYEVGDDNGDGRIDEDESGWDCATMGNHICGQPVDRSHTYGSTDDDA